MATLGTFDGVHLGHQKILNDVAEKARIEGCESVVITFDRHPAEILRPENVPYFLITLEKKIELIAKHDIDHLVIVPFDEAQSQVSANDFIKNVFLDKLSVKFLIVGHDVHFGSGRKGNFSFLEETSSEWGFDVRQVEPVMENEKSLEAISSTAIRRSLRGGEVETARKMLGRPYCISGEVIYGDQRGRTIGFPTANILLPEGRAWPTDGVYAGLFERSDGTENLCAINIGRRPTFYEHATRSLLEAHLIDFEDDLYGELCEVSFLSFIRSERRFDGIEPLVGQLKEDVAKVRSLAP